MNRIQPDGKRTVGQIFLAPALIGLASLFGLVVALLGDGFWDTLGCLGLGVSVAAIAYRYMASAFARHSWK